ncbi:hormogonium polysaccharide secretion pseudopilin HpsB [Coleofasciculus sp. E2-BRE-01]|uniref:hormogonium polysaccharide secretion pseudopilin HpsB n=1 Tax=Coleofasciculus sp. E2-BRE-01 TaxID=3069524 RepID=UPI0032FA4B7A
MLPPKPQLCSRPPNQAGFTIIESLMAIIVVSILMVAISPVIVISVATRVQARRMEMATQAGRSYLDALRSESIDAPPISDLSGASGSTRAEKISNKLVGIAAPDPTDLPCLDSPDYFPYCSDPSSASPSILYCVDNDGGGCSNDSLKDMVVQAFGVNTETSGDNEEKAEKGYKLGIRVYRADAFTSGRKLVGSTGERELAVTGGTGLKPSQAPLLEMTTEIVTEQTNYDDFCNLTDC